MLAPVSKIQIPTVCHLCAESGEHDIPNLCSACQTSIPYIDNACECCAIPIGNDLNDLNKKSTDGSRCANCTVNRPIYDTSLTVLHYQKPMDVLFNRLKHHRDITVAATFANLLADKIIASNTELPDIILPIPLNWKRQLMRGFNHSQAIAAVLAGKLGINLDTNVLTRVTNNAPQQGLTRAERLKNLDRCFEASKSVRNKKVALVDDVVTTGATMQAAATALYIRGTKSISAWSVARTPDKTN